jgi:N-acetylneuraminate synthase
MSKYDVPFLKIPSAMLTNHELLDAAARTKLPIILSTGMSTLEELDKAVNVLDAISSQYALLHCNSSYPAKLSELNLRMIPFMMERYKCVVGYSGHEYGLDSTTMAVVLGAKLIERHVTLDHTMWGTDHASSVEIQGMDKLYKQVRSVKDVLGDAVKRVYDSEQEVISRLRGAQHRSEG